MNIKSVSIIGCGNIGISIALGLVKAGFNSSNITLTRRKVEHLDKLKSNGFRVTNNNLSAIENAHIIILAVTPDQIVGLCEEISSKINSDQIVVSLVSGIKIKDLKSNLKNSDIIRAMPNTAAMLMESMTCLATENKQHASLSIVKELFDMVGKTLVIDEDQMESATALGACGIAFFLRAIRAASQGGIEIGFHSEEAFTIASQTARGAATLLLDNSAHPESEIDRVTTPKGATIAGLNEMEHQGFSSALIKGITTSTEKVSKLFSEK